MPQSPVAVSTIVSTDMTDPVAKEYGIHLIKVLTGFKYIGDQIALLEEKGKRIVISLALKKVTVICPAAMCVTKTQ